MSGTHQTLVLNNIQRTVTRTSLSSAVYIVFLRKREDGPFVEPRYRDRDAFWKTQIQQAAVNMKRIQVVLQGLAHNVQATVSIFFYFSSANLSYMLNAKLMPRERGRSFNEVSYR